MTMSIAWRYLCILTGFMLMNAGVGQAACVQRVTDGLNVRKGPTVSAETLTLIPAGSCRVAVDNASCKDMWCKATYNGISGWVNSRFLRFESHEKTEKVFNYYIMRAITEIVAKRGGRGYNLRRSYSEDLDYGVVDDAVKRFYWDNDQGRWAYPGGTGETMCVAAVAEVMIEALNLYGKESGDTSFSAKLPADHWKERAQARHLRQHLWEYSGLGSRGAGHALERFNIGRQKSYAELIPGDTLKFNRINGAPGHSTIFVSFVDEAGKELERFGQAAKGFKYFSAQGGGVNHEGRVSTGLGYKVEYFSNTCPSDALKASGRCRVFSVGSTYGPNLGTMFHPQSWGEVGSNYRQELARAIYLARTGKPIKQDVVAYQNTASGSWLNRELETVLSQVMDPSFVGDWEN